MRTGALRILGAAIALTALLPGRAEACSCAGSGPPCQAVWSVDAVFAGIVRAIEEIDHDELGAPYRSKLVRFEIERSFRNATAGGVEIITAASGPACGYGFQVGKRYLVYAWKTKGGRLGTGLCSRTRPLENAADDLQYLTSIPVTATGARVYGRVNQVEWDPGPEVRVDYGPVEGLRVYVTGSGFAREVQTDDDGRYEIAGVPKGSYRLGIVVPPEFDSRYLEHGFEVKDARGCVQADFDVHWEARISGVVVDGDGRPVQGVTVEAVAAEHATAAPRPYAHPEAKTDASGAFELRGVPPARYVIGINLTRPPRPEEPYSRTFFPGTVLPDDAAIVEVAAGDRRTLPAFRLAGPLVEHPLRGCVVGPDGRPSAGALVTLSYGRTFRSVGSGVQTDGSGCFSFRVHHSVDYTLRAFAPTSGGAGPQLSAERAVSVAGPIDGLRLVLAERR